MLAEERRRRILDLLGRSERGAVSIAELCEALRVSDMTVRRDLELLEKLRLLRRVRGGAVAFRPLADEKSFRDRGEEHSQEKQAIGRIAAQLVQSGERIILDAGTTTLEVARNLGQCGDVTALTNALPVAEALCQHPHVFTILLGGMLKPRELCAVGPMVTEQLSRLSVDKLFLSIAGFSVERGLTDQDILEAEVKRAMIRTARQVILVADSSKWNSVHLIKVAELSVLSTLVTDDRISERAIEEIEAEGVQVITPTRFTGSVQAG